MWNQLDGGFSRKIYNQHGWTDGGEITHFHTTRVEPLGADMFDPLGGP